ncbi:MAG: ral nucleoside transport system permease protein [Gaiellaceae bacterium]|nr:ral nucleoside transport system permease protein [Gaiellaceae bacterium]
MSEPEEPGVEIPEGEVPSVASRLALYQRAGGIVAPLLTAFLAFFVGGLVVLVTVHKNPLVIYKAIFNGTGLNWLFPWVHGAERVQAALDLQQTLILTIPLALCALAVAFAFRCGLFNIGGQGQYIVGSLVAVQMGIWFANLTAPLHIALAIGAAALGGAVWGGIAGVLRATVGAHEVITTIMLNWIALWVGSYLVGFGGPLQNKTGPGGGIEAVTPEIAPSAKLHVFWGNPLLQGLHIGLFIALGALVVYWIILNRTTLGYRVRAVGFNAEGARYGGIGVGRSYFLAMAIAGGFAGIAGAVDLLGWEHKLDLTEVQGAQLPFIGIAVALLGRNTAVGIFFSSLLFGSLLNGTSERSAALSAAIDPQLAGNLTRIIQGLVVLFVGADVLILYLWQARRKLRRRRTTGARE